MSPLQTVGISVEFTSHITRSFAISTRPGRLERAKEATVDMGSAVSAHGCGGHRQLRVGWGRCQALGHGERAQFWPGGEMEGCGAGQGLPLAL